MTTELRPDARCWSCDSSALTAFYEAKNVPVQSCVLLDDRDRAAAFPTRDIVLTFCEDCGLIENVMFDPSAVSYSTDYEDSQAHSQKFLDFATSLAEHLVERYDLRGGTALEIGCGKGDFLAILTRVGTMSGVGVDPAFRPGPLVETANGRLRFLTEPYTARHGHFDADVVVCRHTLEHVRDVRGFVDSVRAGLGPRDIPIFFEVPDGQRIFEEGAFWDIYYEHCAYFSGGSLSRLFRRCGLSPLDVRVDYDGQYLLLEARAGSTATEAWPAGQDDISRLRSAVRSFSKVVPARITALQAELARQRQHGKVVVWGASSKAVSYLTALQAGSAVEAVVDINPVKQGRYLAGTGHEIVGPERLQTLRPTTIVLMNPVYRDEVAALIHRLGIAAEVATL